MGSSDRIFYRLQISYTAQVHFWRIAIWVVPLIVFILTRSVCRSLQGARAHPLRSWQGTVLRRGPDGELQPVDISPDRDTPPDTEAPLGTVPGRKSISPE